MERLNSAINSSGSTFELAHYIRMYRQINNELRKVTERARQEWWDSECKAIEELDGKREIRFGVCKS